MSVLLTLLILITPALAKQESTSMSCTAVRETAEVVLEAPDLSKKDKDAIIRRLFGRHGMTCFEKTQDAND